MRHRWVEGLQAPKPRTPLGRSGPLWLQHYLITELEVDGLRLIGTTDAGFVRGIYEAKNLQLKTLCARKNDPRDFRDVRGKPLFRWADSYTKCNNVLDRKGDLGYGSLLFSTKRRKATMTYHQITFEERYSIALLRRQGWPPAAIARALGRHRSTIGRERSCSHPARSSPELCVKVFEQAPRHLRYAA